MKVFLINLDRSPDRLHFMKQQLDSLNLPFERISAVDGKNLDMGKLTEFADPSRVEEWKDLLTPNAIACSLSHHQIYKKMVEEDIEMALILEDDVVLDANFPFVLDQIEKNGLNNTDVFLVYFHGDKKLFSDNRVISINDKHKFYAAKSVWGAYAAGGYIIRKDVAKKLSEFVFPVKFTADSWGVFHRDGAINGLWALLPLLTSSANFGSDIGYTKISGLIRYIEKMPFSPFRKILNFIKKRLKKKSLAYEIVPEDPEW
ncbi:glycosyltransferase family 25 protein [Rufibacter sp. XAAS-G3-1]|uniref:glycosyltransferase family 25 protein n=1 Tax=Rufibacter sp. XAAS-G3-1 TaxID=2729134 RepID=UPI0021051E7B|nr:glycosyltransferase family 25 protein [Rufibacter sp. XAAS-G3-1]